MAEIAKTVEATLAKKEMSQSERFTQEVMKQFTNQAGEVMLTAFQKKLCQNYFIKIDQTLKDLEKKRLAKAENFRDKLEFAWKNVNLQKLAVDVVSFSSVGLDPTQPNHINCIPYKNTGTNKFDIGFIVGYRGAEIKAKKYALEMPDDVIVELVYKNDNFKQMKRDVNNRIESYIFEVTNDFDRGELVGGFYYHSFFSAPEKNRLRVFTKADIEKRRPDAASPEFWGGEKDEWKNGQRTGLKVKVEGWFDEMAYKTIYRAAFNSITIDSQKIDDHYVSVLAKEKEPLDQKVLAEIKQNANLGEAIGFEETTTATELLSTEQQPVVLEVAQEEEKETIQKTDGPGF